MAREATGTARRLATGQLHGFARSGADQLLTMARRCDFTNSEFLSIKSSVFKCDIPNNYLFQHDAQLSKFSKTKLLILLVS